MYKAADFRCDSCGLLDEGLVSVPSGGSILGHTKECVCGGVMRTTLSAVPFWEPSEARTFQQLKDRAHAHSASVAAGGEPEPGGKPYLARHGGYRKSRG